MSSGFDYIVPINTTQADTTNPIFFLGMWGFVAFAFTYLAFMWVVRSASSIKNGTRAAGWSVMLADFILNLIFGMMILIALYGAAWGGYINTILYNFVPNDSPKGTYGLTLQQDFYCLAMTSIGLLYMACQFTYKYYLVWKRNKGNVLGNLGEFNDYIAAAQQPDKVKDFGKGEDAEDIILLSKEVALQWGTFSYIVRFYALMLCVLGWIITPGAYAYAANRDLIAGGAAWLVLVLTIMLGGIMSWLYYYGVRNQIEYYFFPSVNTIIFSEYGDNPTHAVVGYLVGQRVPAIFIIAYMFYVFAAEIMLFGDQMKPVASAFICLLLPLLMTGAAKDASVFMPFHISIKTYYFLINYWMLTVKTPALDSTVIDKTIVDYNSGTTGPEYRFLNTYYTTFVTTAAVGFGFACLFMLKSFADYADDHKHFKIVIDRLKARKDGFMKLVNGN
jgi:hypothetical protein